LSDYEGYDGIGLAALVRAREVRPTELLEAETVTWAFAEYARRFSASDYAQASRPVL
jgi:hypothetical protein